ncbi:MAG: tetratricopeptide repeat protein [Magnetococcales bacterium]|nr:tetratricopeptide repeat protein [Magnetococcales bacterium]
MNRAERRRQKSLSEKSFQSSHKKKHGSSKAQDTMQKGLFFHQSGQLNDAIHWYKKSLEVQPDSVRVLANLAGALFDNRKFSEAVKTLQKAVEIKPDNAENHFNLALALKADKKDDEAINSLKKAILLKPEFAQAHNNLRFALGEQLKMDEAIEFYTQILSQKPNCHNTHFQLGKAFEYINEIDESVACFKKAIAIKHDFADAHTKLGIYYEKINDTTKAYEHINYAINSSKDDPQANYVLSVLLRRSGKIDESIQQLEPFTSMEIPDQQLSAKIYFELGKLYDRKKNSRKAFENFKLGNSLQASGSKAALSRNKHRFLSKVKQDSRLITPEWVKSWSTIEEKKDYASPVFIIGFPRSGTTLLDQILDSHPRVQVMEEREAVSGVKKSIPDDYASYLSTLNSADAERLRESYYTTVNSYINRLDNTILVDKLPLNILYIPLIIRLFPKAKIILAMRHPCDVVLSNFMQNYKLNNAMANFLTIDDTVQAYVQVMGLWLKYADLLPLRLHTIKYESLVEDMEGEAVKLLKFIDVEWDDCVLNYHQHAKQRGAINTPSYQSVTEPIYQRAKYRWKSYEEQLNPFIEKLQPFIKAFGY